MKVLGIYREEKFSPGKIKEDRDIMDKTLKEIARFGANIEAVSADCISEKDDVDLILNMAQSVEVVSLLNSWERNGIRIINSPDSIINCYRVNMINILKENDFPIPKSWIYDLKTLEEELFKINPAEWIGYYWIKRGDYHAIEPADVVKTSSFKDMENALTYFKKNRVDKIVVQEHVEGRVIKFYGAGEEYIKAFLLPEIKEIEINQKLRELILKAKKCLGLEIYGGDMIIADGNIWLIDVNDWPSFSLCQDEAAERIAMYIKRIMEDFDDFSTPRGNGK